jgi:Flp pilus assembly protein TadD
MARQSGLLALLVLLAACKATAPILNDPLSAFDLPSATEKGYAALAAGNYPIAVRWLSLVATDKPNDPYLMLDLAAAYQKLGKFDDAQRRYQILVDIAADITPSKVTDPALSGKSLAEIAAADLALCVSCDLSDDARRGYAALGAGDAATAWRLLSDAAAAKPDDPYLRLDLAAVARKLGKFDEARSADQKTLELAPPGKPVTGAPAIPGRTLDEIAAADLDALASHPPPNR